MTRVADVLADASARIATALMLERSVARLEARVLAAFAWKIAPSWLLAHDTDPLDRAQAETFQALLLKRLHGIPIAYLTGTREFYGRDFVVTPDVLIPRPETELLVDLALARMPAGEAIEVLDLGTGSGCIAITLALERPHARVTAVERSDAALAVARRNAEQLHAELEFLVSDWFAALGERQFDLIVGNPPYIATADPHLGQGDVRFEPSAALMSGSAGLDDCRQIIATAHSHLKPGGQILLEHGHDQGGAMQNLLCGADFKAPHTWQDLAGIDRISGGIMSE